MDDFRHFNMILFSVILSILMYCCPFSAHSEVQPGWKDFHITDFSAVHAPVGDGNKHVIFGNIPITVPNEALPSEFSAFVGRWEGYDFAPPVSKDFKIVLVITKITKTGGKACIWGGTNLQYPDGVKKIQFTVHQDSQPFIEWTGYFNSNSANVFFSYNKDTQELKGGIAFPHTPDQTFRDLRLQKSRSFYVYQDYERYLETKRIYTSPFKNQELRQYGLGYMFYLPEGYEAFPDKTWPLLFFLHGSGDR